MTMLSERPANWADSRHVVFADSRPRSGPPVNFGAVSHPPRPAPTLTPDQRTFVAWLFRRGGLDIDLYREETLARRLPACLRAVRASCVAGARAAIPNDSALCERALGALVIGVTSFFRDFKLFEELQNTILPRLVSAGKMLRIWSVGCSDGQELYSVAMLLAELGWLNRTDFLGTDCRPQAVRCASAGVYPDKDLASVPPNLAETYFSRVESGWQIQSRVRTVIRWRTADATKLVEPGSWDMILCRNMAMYLEPAASRKLWMSFAEALNPGGFLVVGKAERPGIDGLVPAGRCIFQKSHGLSLLRN